MKFNFVPSPNYHDKQSTQRIMLELTIGLLAIYIFSVVYYMNSYGSEYGIRAIGLLIASIIAATLTEVIYDVILKKNVLESLKSSFPWVTAIILTMMCSINISYYALFVSTVIAIFFGKLVFGGFGQNIFNPAAFGRAVIMAAFSGSVSADFITSATPTTAMASAGWIMNSGTFDTFINTYGGWEGMFLGTYPGAIGETCTIFILIVGVILAIRKVLDWRIPVVYIATMLITTFIIGTVNGAGIWYAAFHVCTGGAIFGAIFMMTDPVTNPTDTAGRIIYAMGCAFITIIIRLNANLPEGVLYSILIMNMLTPAIERALDGNQVKNHNKRVMITCIIGIIGLVITCGLNFNLKANEETTDQTAVAQTVETNVVTTSNEVVGQ